MAVPPVFCQGIIRIFASEFSHWAEDQAGLDLL
jgi:hypothetical protein